jgi:hypothetical protein
MTLVYHGTTTAKLDSLLATRGDFSRSPSYSLCVTECPAR